MLPEQVKDEAPYSGRQTEESADPEQPLSGLQHVGSHANARARPGRTKGLDSYSSLYQPNTFTRPGN